MESGELLRMIVALVFVLGLIALLAWLARRLRLGGALPGAGQRLAIVELRPLDARRRLVLVRRDQVEHLLLIAGDHSIVIETGIPPPPGEPRRAPERAREAAA